MHDKSPQHTNSVDSEPRDSMSRRRLLKALAGAGLASVGVFSLNKLRVEDEDNSIEQTPKGPFELETSVPSTEVSLTPELDNSEPLALGNAESLQAIAETETEEALVLAFQITKEEAPTPSALGALVATRVQDWVTAGCTPEKASQHTPETLTDYQDEMSEIFGTAAASGLGGEAGLKSSPDANIRSTALFQKINIVHGQVLEHYLKMTRSGAANSAKVAVEVLNQPEGAMYQSNASESLFHMVYDLRITITSDQTEPFIIEGSLNIALHTKKPVYELVLDDETPTPPFKMIN